MDIKKEDLHIQFTPKTAIKIDEFLTQFTSLLNDYEENNIILDLTKTSYTIDDLLKFNTISEKNIELGTSFVIIFNEIDIDSIPDELIVVPTFQEALDMIEMDEMTRSLDF